MTDICLANTFQSLISNFRVTELQQLLGFAQRRKNGRKSELFARALSLVNNGCPSSIAFKIHQLARLSVSRFVKFGLWSCRCDASLSVIKNGVFYELCWVLTKGQQSWWVLMGWPVADRWATSKKVVKNGLFCPVKSNRGHKTVNSAHISKHTRPLFGNDGFSSFFQKVFQRIKNRKT